MSKDESVGLSQLKEQLSSMVKLVEKLELEGKAQQASTSESYLGELPYRVIHLNDNPAELEIRKKDKELVVLKKENERLKARLELLESGNDVDVTRRIDDAVNCAHQIETLKRQLNECKQREFKILDSFKKTSREFREVCYLLTGYRVDALKDRIYRLTNMYAESEDDKLLFEITPDGQIQLLRSDYCDRLSDYIKTYLEMSDSFPAFLSSITLDLFKSSTQQEPMSMCMSMSETIMPNPGYRPTPKPSYSFGKR